MSYLDFKNAIDTIEDIISSGFKRKTSISSFITKCLKNSETGLLSIGGTRTTVKELVGVATSSPTKLSTLYKRILSNSTKGSLINSILPIFSGNAGLIISIAIDIIFGSVVDVYMLVAIPIANYINMLIQKLGSAAIKILLLPFVGPLSWLFDFIFESLYGFFGIVFDVVSSLANFISGILKSSSNMFIGIINTIMGV